MKIGGWEKYSGNRNASLKRAPYGTHPYQKFCVDFLEEKPQCALFLDCGLGKTIITLTAISHLLYDSYEVSRVLIIAPLRVARDTWMFCPPTQRKMRRSDGRAVRGLCGLRFLQTRLEARAGCGQG